MISQESIKEVQSIAHIEEVISDFIAIRKKGNSYVALCPFHNDKNPSMHINPIMGIYKCFVCDAGGDAIKFVMEYAKMTYPEAIRYLAQKYQIQLQETTASQTPEEVQIQTEKESLYNVNSFAAKYFTDQLLNTEYGQAVAASYLKERQVSDEMIQKFQIGYHPDSWEEFSKYAVSQGYSMDNLLKLGLSKKNGQGKIFDLFKGRLMFPIHNTMGKIAGFGGRIMMKSDHQSKYFNSPESLIYHKSDILYGFYFAKKAIRKEDCAYLVEGYMDVVSMHQVGIENVVASSGTALTENQIKLIASQTKNITVLYDGDEAGIKASLRSVDMILASGLNIKVITLPETDDPDSFSKTHSKAEILDYFEKNARNFISFKAHILSQNCKNDPIQKTKVINEILENITEVDDLIVKSLYIKECAGIFNIAEETLQQQLRVLTYRKKKKKATSQIPSKETDAVDISETTVAKADILENDKQALDYKELALLKLIVLQGNKEIYIKEFTDDEENCNPTRVDQFIYNTLTKEFLTFTNPIYETMFEEYANAAENGEDIQHHFIHHSSEEISKIYLDLINHDDIPSEAWKNKYQLSINTPENDMTLLIKEIENTLHAFKLEKVNCKIAELQKELTATSDVIKQEELLRNIHKLNQIKSKIGKTLGIVICS